MIFLLSFLFFLLCIPFVKVSKLITRCLRKYCNGIFNFELTRSSPFLKSKITLESRDQYSIQIFHFTPQTHRPSNQSKFPPSVSVRSPSKSLPILSNAVIFFVASLEFLENIIFPWKRKQDKTERERGLLANKRLKIFNHRL